MSSNWPTKNKDLATAKLIMEEFATGSNGNQLGLMELYVDERQKKMDFRLSEWVVLLAKHFNATYGATQGDYVTRQVISRCMTNGETVH